MDVINISGDSCNHKETNSAGLCVLLKFCQAALADLSKGKNPQLCGFQGLVPIVCCLDNDPKIRITTEAPKPPKPVRKPGEIADQSRFNNFFIRYIYENI